MRKIVSITIGLLLFAVVTGNVFGEQSKGIKDEITPFSSHPEIVVDLNKQYALLIGINEYDKLPHLYNAVYDAWSVKEILIDNYGFKKDNIIEIYNKEASWVLGSPFAARFCKSATWSGERTFFRPRYAPRCFARAMPSLCRSRIKARSNSANAPMIDSMRFAMGESSPVNVRFSFMNSIFTPRFVSV